MYEYKTVNNFLWITLLYAVTAFVPVYGQEGEVLLPFRFPFPDDMDKVERLDFDKDGDPDAIRYTIHGGIPVMWVDDDDDMKANDWEGDIDNDCVLIDRDKDGTFAGPWDFSVDYGDENGDGVADVQLVVGNGDSAVRNEWDWAADIMWFIDDGEQDANFAYVDWNKIDLKCWEHYGHANFYADYHGQTTFTKMNVSSFRMHDFRYSWENPFYFFDMDGDTHSEMAIRLEDTPVFKNKPEGINGRVDNSLFKDLDEAIDVTFIGVLDKGYISFDLDNDNAPSNEFDFDMSLQFNGEHGYDYNHMKQPFSSIDGLKAADTFMFDSRWRHLSELVYPTRDASWDILFKEGNWEACWFVFDEDDDCARWERVELLQPKELFITGMRNEGLDHNPQADEIGDRGEFDLDNSGKGNLYIAPFDGRMHLYGAEWGAWRIDQDAYSYQGYGGLYDRSGYVRSQLKAPRFGTVKYSDTDGNGFIDLLEYDLNGDTLFEHTLSFKALGIDDTNEIISMQTTDYKVLSELYQKMGDAIWDKGQRALATLEGFGLNTAWYAFYKQPKSLREKYSYGYWINFYCYWDLRKFFEKTGNQNMVVATDKAFLSGKWEALPKKK